MRKIITKFIGWKSENTYYDWKKQNRPIILFLEKYFEEKDLKEFLETGKISKLETKEIENQKIYSHENVMIDNAIYTAKDKLKRFWGDKWFDVRIGIKKDIKNIIKEIKLNNENYSMENSKEILIKYIMGDKMNKPIVYNENKKTLISNFINEELSEVESYTILEHSDRIFN